MPASPLASDEMTASAAAPRWGRFFVLRNRADKGVQNVAGGKAAKWKAERVVTEETSLLDDGAAALTHEFVVSINLAGKSQPATRNKFQREGLSLTLR
jgi:hypothetical protein